METETTGTDVRLTVEKGVRAIADFAASDESRPVLTSIRVKDGVLIAADGFTLARVPVSRQEHPEFLVSAKWLKGVLSRIRVKKSDAHNIELYQSGETSVVEYGDDRSEKELIDGSFPDGDDLIANVSETPALAQFAIDPEYLIRVGKLAKSLSARAVEVEVRKEGRAVLFTARVEDAPGPVTMLVMPMNLGAG